MRARHALATVGCAYGGLGAPTSLLSQSGRLVILRLGHTSTISDCLARQKTLSARGSFGSVRDVDPNPPQLSSFIFKAICSTHLKLKSRALGSESPTSLGLAGAL